MLDKEVKLLVSLVASVAKVGSITGSMAYGLLFSGSHRSRIGVYTT